LFFSAVVANSVVSTGAINCREIPHSFIHIHLIEKVVRTQLNIRIQHKTSIG